MYYYNEATHELKDNEIMNALDDCITSYEDGEIIVVKHTLQAILSAIKQFERDYDKGVAG